MLNILRTFLASFLLASVFSVLLPVTFGIRAHDTSIVLHGRSAHAITDIEGAGHQHWCDMDGMCNQVEELSSPYITYRETITSEDTGTQSNFGKIRIHYDISNMMHDVENRTCYSENDIFRRGNPLNEEEWCSDTNMNDCFSACERRFVVTHTGVELFQNEILNWITHEKLPSLLQVRSVEKLSLPSRVERCGVDGGVSIREEHQAPNGLEADLLIYVTSRPPTPGVLGFAVPCFMESVYGRVVVAQINIAPEVLDMSLSVRRGIALHETMHVLGFSSFAFQNFRDENGNKQDPNDILKMYTKTHTSRDGTEHEQTFIMLTTRSLVERARKHFGCETLQGIDLEEFGSPGTVNSHWDKLILINELMIGSVSWFNPSETWSLSEFTLAVLEDSGWYHVNYSGADPMLWGKNVGCELLQERCENWKFADQFDGYFCRDSREEQCTFNLRGKGLCGIKDYDQPLEFYEHFADQPHIGGTIPSASYCPIVLQQKSCVTGQVSDSISGTDSEIVPMRDFSAAQFEHYGLEAGCFRGHITARGNSDNPLMVSDKAKLLPQCLRYSCNRTSTTIRGNDREPVLSILIGDTWLDCPADQSEHIFHLDAISNEFTGTVMCPPQGYSILCQYELPVVDNGRSVVPKESPSLEPNQESGVARFTPSLWSQILIWTALLLIVFFVQ